MEDTPCGVVFLQYYSAETFLIFLKKVLHFQKKCDIICDELNGSIAQLVRAHGSHP